MARFSKVALFTRNFAMSDFGPTGWVHAQTFDILLADSSRRPSGVACGRKPARRGGCRYDFLR